MNTAVLFVGDVFASLHRPGMDGYAFPVMKGLRGCGGVPNVHLFAHEMLGGTVPVLEHFEMAIDIDSRSREASQLLWLQLRGKSGGSAETPGSPSMLCRRGIQH